MTRKVNVWKKAELRRGGAESGPDNVIDKDLGTGDYDAFHQCVGETITHGSAKNSWWVKIRANGQEGWVAGVYVDKDGQNEAPIRDIDEHELPQEPTRFC
jgi:hypothetical protein